MAFVKYEPDVKQKPEKPSFDVKIGKLGISIKKSALETFGISNATHLALYFDSDTASIGIVATGSDDKAAFKATPRGKGGENLFVASGKFYTRFNIEISGKGLTSNLRREGEYTAFTIPGVQPAAAAPKKPYTGAKRGPKPKAA